MSKGKKNNTESVVASAMREVNMAMREVAEATAPLNRMSRNQGDIETDSLPYTNPARSAASSQPKMQNKDGGIQIKHPGLFGGSNTVINIQSAQNIQIGNNNTMIVNSSSRRTQYRNVSPPRATQQAPPKVDRDIVRQVLESKRAVEERDLMIASTSFMGQQWRRALRLIGLEDIEIESKYQDFYAQGVKEVTFQAMKHWKQRYPDTATIGHLTKALSELHHPDEVCDKFKP